jgi:hypothetical protein
MTVSRSINEGTLRGFPINVTELGGGPPYGTANMQCLAYVAFTDTDASGAFDGNFDCSGWTSTGANMTAAFGDVNVTNLSWSFGCGSNDGCGLTASLYCFEQ